MNIDEGKHALNIVNDIYPLSNWNRILYIGISDKTFREWNGDYFLHHISNHIQDFTCTIVEKYEQYAVNSAAGWEVCIESHYFNAMSGL